VVSVRDALRRISGDRLLVPLTVPGLDFLAPPPTTGPAGHPSITALQAQAAVPAGLRFRPGPDGQRTFLALRSLMDPSSAKALPGTTTQTLDWVIATLDIPDPEAGSFGDAVSGPSASPTPTESRPAHIMEVLVLINATTGRYDSTSFYG
jgi:hypothetical protein